MTALAARIAATADTPNDFPLIKRQIEAQLNDYERAIAAYAAFTQAVMARAFADQVADGHLKPRPLAVVFPLDQGADSTLKRGAIPKSTIDAAEYLVRQGDRARLRKWLDVHSAAERAAISKHLEAM